MRYELLNIDWGGDYIPDPDSFYKPENMSEREQLMWEALVTIARASIGDREDYADNAYDVISQVFGDLELKNL